MTKWRERGKTAVITGGAKGIGLAAAEQFVRDGMNVLIADRDETALEEARARLEPLTNGSKVIAQTCDVTDLAQLEALRETAFGTLGGVHCLMNNAGVGLRVGPPWENLDELRKTLDINLFGVIYGCHVFIPAMLKSGAPGVVINTGSKQGITRPPGNYAYNLSKAGVLAYTESIAHTFTVTDGCQLTAHLLLRVHAHGGKLRPGATAVRMDRRADGRVHVAVRRARGLLHPLPG
jgi:NAD(P)-dependent dehydrogenase (short-subunit alcohol dehydrogenase family)